MHPTSSNTPTPMFQPQMMTNLTPFYQPMNPYFPQFQMQYPQVAYSPYPVQFYPMTYPILPPVQNSALNTFQRQQGTQIKEECESQEQGRPRDDSHIGLKTKFIHKMATVRSAQGYQLENKRGHWTEEEHYAYLKFMRNNQALFANSSEKKLNRVFKMMAQEIPTRTACQCRSHFTKFNPQEQNNKLRRKLTNDEQVYQKKFEKE